MASSQRSPIKTGFDLFFEEMTQILTEHGLQSHANVVNLLNAFDTLDMAMKRQINQMAEHGYQVLPRCLADYLCKHFIIDSSDPSSGLATARRANDVNQIQRVPQPSSPPDPIVSHKSNTIQDGNAGSGNAAVQQPGGSAPPNSIVSDADLLAAASSPVICTAGCLNSAVLGTQNFATLKHPHLQNVYLKVPIEILTASDMPPTAVPLLFDRSSSQSQSPSTSDAITVLQGPRMALLTTSLGEVANIMSAMIRVVSGAIYIYDVMSKTWQYLWGH